MITIFTVFRIFTVFSNFLYEPEDEPNAPDPFTRQDEIENPSEQQLIEMLYNATESF